MNLRTLHDKLFPHIGRLIELTYFEHREGSIKIKEKVKGVIDRLYDTKSRNITTHTSSAQIIVILLVPQEEVFTFSNYHRIFQKVKVFTKTEEILFKLEHDI